MVLHTHAGKKPSTSQHRQTRKEFVNIQRPEWGGTGLATEACGREYQCSAPCCRAMNSAWYRRRFRVSVQGATLQGYVLRAVQAARAHVQHSRRGYLRRREARNRKVGSPGSNTAPDPQCCTARRRHH